MKTNLLFVFASCSKNAIDSEIASMNEEVVQVQGKKTPDPTAIPICLTGANNLSELADALNHYDDCKSDPDFYGCTKKVIEEMQPVGCKYSVIDSEFPMSSTQVYLIYQQLASCGSLLTCNSGQFEKYDFIFEDHKTGSICGDYVEVYYYTLRCCVY